MWPYDYYGYFLQGLSSEYDLKKIIKVAKKEFACNGTVVDHSEYGEVLQLQVRNNSELVFICELLFGCPTKVIYLLHFWHWVSFNVSVSPSLIL